MKLIPDAFFTAFICQQEYRTQNLVTLNFTREWYKGLKDKKKNLFFKLKGRHVKGFLFCTISLSLTLIPLAQVCHSELLYSPHWTLGHCDDGLFLYGPRSRTEQKHTYTFICRTLRQSQKSNARHLVVQCLNSTHFQKLHPYACSCTVCESWVWFKHHFTHEWIWEYAWRKIEHFPPNQKYSYDTLMFLKIGGLSQLVELMTIISHLLLWLILLVSDFLLIQWKT